MQTVLDRFIRYAKIDTMSDPTNEAVTPSAPKEHDLAKVVYQDLLDLGVDAYYDKEHCYVYGFIPGNNGETRRLAFISHLDTSPAVSDTNVNPKLWENYQGTDLDLHGDGNFILHASDIEYLDSHIGHTLLTTDGTTLLGGDDKAGVAEIMTMVQTLVSNPEIKHRPIAVVFTPDEEIGHGAELLDLERLGAYAGYTVDGGHAGELTYENFDAAGAVVTFKGISVHTGSAKGKMINASLVALEFAESLPKSERPEHTEGYEGFYHLDEMKGECESAELTYIIRDFTTDGLEARKKVFAEIADKLNRKYGAGTVEVKIHDQYQNMASIIRGGYFELIDTVLDIYKKLGVTPDISPIRGGTDGARLSFRGLPCPNLGTGGGNFHSRYEYVDVDEMNTMVSVIVELTK